jgi:hypothetical protein
VIFNLTFDGRNIAGILPTGAILSSVLPGERETADFYIYMTADDVAKNLKQFLPEQLRVQHVSPQKTLQGEIVLSLYVYPVYKRGQAISLRTKVEGALDTLGWSYSRLSMPSRA